MVGSALMEAGHEVHRVLESRDASFYVRFSLLLGNIYLSTSLSPINTNLTVLNEYLLGVTSYEDLVRESLIPWLDPNDFRFIRGLHVEIYCEAVFEDWLPPNDLLGHPSTQLFITHCGNNGQHEALYHGVPMLGFPLFAEQDKNARKIIALDYGITMDILSFTKTKSFENIQEVIHNPKYKTTIQRVSKAFREQPMTARQKTVFWIEHVIKHGGDPLRSSAMDLPMYQFLCFDTLALLIKYKLDKTFHTKYNETESLPYRKQCKL
ncbi:hypothetical protein HELRODRAFT_174537 [Helobdella robusta]|uniref:Glucuronosyltransferase n=1 Tax=Helobdella robusta TaxID=6412 RepID=T1F884_HELRO|nr:hypothetical protein HELRODRAFT_174537 [Helobdella robusta]ESO01580.1 hypothetical protein HELRODRAFT_174537 [Helobdella robusta]